MDKKKLLTDLKVWIDYGIEADVLWRPEFKEFVEKIKTDNPEITDEHLVDKLQEVLKC